MLRRGKDQELLDLVSGTLLQCRVRVGLGATMVSCRVCQYCCRTRPGGCHVPGVRSTGSEPTTTQPDHYVACARRLSVASGWDHCCAG